MPPGGWTLVKEIVISSFISIQFGWLLRFSIGIVFTKDYVRNLKPQSPLRSWAHQCPDKKNYSSAKHFIKKFLASINICSRLWGDKVIRTAVSTPAILGNNS